MLETLRNLIHQARMAGTPAARVQPMYDPFRVQEVGPVLTPEERLEARRQRAQRYVAENVPRFHVERLT